MMEEKKPDPMMCDATGAPLAYEDGRTVWVELRAGVDEDPWNVGDRTGIVASVPKEGSDWYGFPLVAFRGAKKHSHHVANSALLVISAPPKPAEVDFEALQELRALAERYDESGSDLEALDAMNMLGEVMDLVRKL